MTRVALPTRSVGPLLLRSVAPLLLLTCVGCAAQREAGLPVVYGSQVRLDGSPAKKAAAAADEPLDPMTAYASWWQEVPDDFGTQSAPRPPSIKKRLAARRKAAPVRRIVEEAPALAVPQRKARAEARPEGKASGKNTAQLARDHYLDYPTHLQAQKITFACPRGYADRVRLTGDDTDRSNAGRVRVQGNAKLVIGELTLEAQRITWRIQPAGKLDIQILARGEVHFVSTVRGKVARETAIRSLVITNDQLIPLR